MKKKAIILVIIFILMVNAILPVANAYEITKANLINDHSIATHIKYESSTGVWSEIKCNYICYKIDGKKYPVYCIVPGVHGVDEEGDYTVKIKDLLKDKLIYNIILNGYPYKTPTQLGVETVDDAYVATKHAIKCGLLDRDIRSFYKASDSKGEKIINAIEKILKEGKKKSITNQDASIYISKVGDLAEKGDYYYQEYKVNADVAISSYTIENLAGFSKDSYITDINGTKKEEFSGGQNFRVMIPKTDLVQDIDGKIKISASCKTNAIFYGEAPNSKVQDYAITYEPYANYETVETFTQKNNTAKIKIIKQDEETSKPIQGVEFSLYTKTGELIETKITDKEGIATFDSLYQGIYKLKETKSNENYVQNDTVYEISTEYNKQFTQVVINAHKKGNLKIIKVDKDNPDVTLGAIEFDLINEEKNIVAHLVTDANGEAEVKNINVGKYILKETATKREYNLCENEEIIVKWNETSEYLIKNEKKKGQIKIIKEDEDIESIKLKGVGFQILDKYDKVVEEITTNDKGEAISSRLPIGEYKIKETNLGDNENKYLLNNNIYTVTIQDNKVIPITIKNKRQEGNLKIYKVDKDDVKLPIENVKFQVIDEDGIKYNIVTNSEGIAEINNIRTGKVTIKEIETNNKYALSKEKYEIQIEYNKCANITITNEKKKGQVEIYKVDKENRKVAIPNVEFQILNVQNEIVDTLITNENGWAISKRLPIGFYYLKEIKTDSKYLLNDEVFKIEIKENAVSCINIENKKIKGRIQIIKTSSKDSPIVNIKRGGRIAEIVFEIYDDKGKLVETVVTNEKGEALSKELGVGRYKIVEKNADKLYLLNTNEFFTEIKTNGEVKILNIENEPIIPLVYIEKTGQKYAEKNEEIKYEFKIENKSNGSLENFTWIEHIPYQKATITKMVTGLYNENLNYDIYYKTNHNDYRFFKTVNTGRSEYLTFNELSLKKNEVITDIKVEYNSVSKDFKSDINPCIFVKISDKVKQGEIITNITELSGNVEQYRVDDKSSVDTIIQEKKILKKLPKTGC